MPIPWVSSNQIRIEAGLVAKWFREAAQIAFEQCWSKMTWKRYEKSIRFRHPPPFPKTFCKNLLSMRLQGFWALSWLCCSTFRHWIERGRIWKVAWFDGQLKVSKGVFPKVQQRLSRGLLSKACLQTWPPFGIWTLAGRKWKPLWCQQVARCFQAAPRSPHHHAAVQTSISAQGLLGHHQDKMNKIHLFS